MGWHSVRCKCKKRTGITEMTPVRMAFIGPQR